MLKMDEINKIRKAFFTHGESKNQIAKRFKRSWDTINQIVSMGREDLKNRGKRPSRGGTVVTSDVELAVEEYLKEEQGKLVKKKQRYTAKKIYEDLRAKGIFKGSIRSMQGVVKKLRGKHDQSKKPSYLPLSFPLGSALQKDHGEADLMISGHRFKGYLFVASVPGEVLRYCQIFPTKSQEAWGEFHERAFRFFGGVFNRTIYDNDSVLVKKVIGSERHQTNFSLSLEEHFGFESHFCNVAAGNEKGAVENGVGYCRRNFLAGTPSFSNWDEVNQHLETSCAHDILKGKHYKTNKPLYLVFEALKQKLEPLPPRKRWSKSVDCRVDSCQLIGIDHHEYSVPEKYVGSYVRVALGVFQLKVFKDEELIAIHERQYGDSGSLDLNHYLDQLQYKAAAFWDCKAVHDHQFDQRYLEIWRRLSERLETKEANRQFVKILLLGRRYSQKDLLKAIELSLKYGAIDHSAVENILRQQDVQYPTFNEEELQKELKSAHIFSWEFDLAPYAKLCEEVLS
jgi:transposase